MERIGIVTDSTAYLNTEQKERMQVRVVSLTITFDGESIPEEGLFNNFDDFYEKLSRVSYLPTTSQPSVGEFIKVYQDMAQHYDHIISVHLSRGISGSVKTAQTAANLLPEIDITVIDTQAACIGEYLAIDAGWRAIQAGYELSDVVRVIRYVVGNLSLYFMPSTLEYLRRGGRIGGAASLVGTLLQIRPILFFNPQKDCIIDLYERVRTRERGLQRMLDEMKKAYDLNPNLKTAVIHVGAKTDGLAWRDRIHGLYPQFNPDFCEVGPVVGAHIGPGTLGLGFYPLTPELKEIIKM